MEESGPKYFKGAQPFSEGEGRGEFPTCPQHAEINFEQLHLNTQNHKQMLFNMVADYWLVKGHFF